MILQQAERDGYSLFVVVPIDPEAPLHHTEADDFASTLEPEPTFEGEDMELQAALQASLMCGVGGGPSSGSAFNMSGGHPPAARPLSPLQLRVSHAEVVQASLQIRSNLKAETQTLISQLLNLRMYR
ncbi:hypothetical protein PAXINDRAFT_103937 [Paxillus involutus ATCC 200175]|uniref:Uncharacterized protein n=1 Tax=Paxillus involutus ATCC 200175 TaxID=664439 RepID=A0A0C9T9Y5_PAXIN|nr:hypothetical protein PAXINDRAFT_103937 [Paxillus involutus ATCC 200175]